MTTTASSTLCNRGDVFLAAVRFSDGSGVKRRPVIVVSVDAFHASRADALVVPLTTRVDVRRFGDAMLLEWQVAGLPRPSLAKGVIETIDRAALRGRLGSLTDRDMGSVDSALQAVLGL